MTKFKIHTLDWRSFDEACRELRSLSDSSGFRPDMLVAIPRGGEYLRQSDWSDIPALEISISKPATFSIKKMASGLLPLLPSALRDRLRIWDARRLISRSGHMENTKISVPAIPAHVKKLLIIDDAVDSGATLMAVISAIKSVRGDLDIRSAAITVTAEKPLYMPDYYLYHDSTLVRMPWSIDAK